MGKFTDVKYTSTVDNLVKATKSKIDNPYYVFSNQSPTKVTYYAQNVEQSTLDEASGLYGAHVGKDSPFKFNKILGFLLYGIERITVDYEVGDYGTEANPIEGEAILLPNTITPRVGDFFYIDYVKEPILFKVNSVTTDTLDTGANLYKVNYTLELTNAIEKIEAQVEKKFNFLTTNIGTDFKAIIQDCDFDLVEKLEGFVEDLITYFENIFFDTRLQTFVFNHDGWHMYDPYMIEFLIRNKVMQYGDKYLFVDHATSVHKTFSMDYSKSFFRSLEDRNPKKLQANFTATANMILDPNSLFYTRMEKYYSINHASKDLIKSRLQTFDPEVIFAIKENKYFEADSEKKHYNLWVAYFNEDKDWIRDNLLDSIKAIDYMNNLDHFYALPISIFIIERYIEGIVKK